CLGAALPLGGNGNTKPSFRESDAADDPVWRLLGRQMKQHACQRAAVTMISIFLLGDCKRVSMQARAGAVPFGTQASQTLLNSSTVRMSVSQMVTASIL